MEIYQPSDDTYFFSEFLEKFLKKHNPKSFLEVGCGSAYLSEIASKCIGKEKIICSDVNPNAVKLAMEKGFNVIESNLFAGVTGKFDVIVFNAPYLPLDKREPKSSQLATTGGKCGDEISLKFLKQAKKHLNENGKIFLLVSNLTPMEKIKKFRPKIVARKKFFMEELLILEFQIN
jgi:release factor glutamine methyltransferase